MEPNQIEPVPKIGIKLDTEFIKGMGKKEEQFIIILDIDNIFSKSELDLIGKQNTIQKTNNTSIDNTNRREKY